jgi:hypothetical protein
MKVPATELEMPRIERSREQALPLPGVRPVYQPFGQLPRPHPLVRPNFWVLAGELRPKPDFSRWSGLSGIGVSRWPVHGVDPCAWWMWLGPMPAPWSETPGGPGRFPVPANPWQ